MAAGQGFKTFTTGEVLTAGDVNGYLMQGINVFASNAARDAAITSPQEGQFAYTKDTNSLWYYTGSAWAASGATGDIEGVTAGTGLTGGGTSGTVTLAFDVANYGGGSYAAGKNAIINGDFGIWQRGTTFTFTGSGGYSADRWLVDGDRTSMGASQQTFTPGTAPVAGYEGQYFLRWSPGTSGSFSNIQTKLEDVRTFAGQTVTLSYWAKCSTGTITNEPYYIQRFGSGGSADASVALATSTITTTWTRFTQTFTIPSISGKTIGTNNCLVLLPLRLGSGTTTTIDVWGVQLEAESVATDFVTASGNSKQGELAMCQRYYTKTYNLATAPATVTNNGKLVCGASSIYMDYQWSPQFPVPMRTTPTITLYSNATGTSGKIYDANGASDVSANSTAEGERAFSVSAVVVSGRAYGLHYVASAEL